MSIGLKKRAVLRFHLIGNPCAEPVAETNYNGTKSKIEDMQTDNTNVIGKKAGLAIFGLITSAAPLLSAATLRKVDLTWNPSLDAKVAGCKVDYGCTHGDYTKAISPGKLTHFDIAEESPGF